MRQSMVNVECIASWRPVHPTANVGPVGPNFFIWIAIAVVIVSTIPAFSGHYVMTFVGWAVAIALAIFNKVRAVRRKRAEAIRNFD